MTERERKQYIAYMTLKDELDEEERLGYSLSFKGEEASSDEIARICIFQEQSSYMRDYAGGRELTPRRLNFDPVNP